MVHVSETATVRKNAVEVFQFFADWSRLADWNPGVRKSARTSSGPIGKGTTYEVTVDLNGEEELVPYTVTLFEPPNRIVLVGDGASNKIVEEARFTQSDGTPPVTTVEYKVEVAVKGWRKVLSPIMGSAWRENARGTMQGLEKALNTGTH